MPHEIPENESLNLQALFEKYLKPEDREIIEKLKEVKGAEFQRLYAEWVDTLQAEIVPVTEKTKDQHREHIEMIKFNMRKGIALYNIEYFTESLAELRAAMGQFNQLEDDKLQEESTLENDLFAFGTHVRGKVDKKNEF